MTIKEAIEQLKDLRRSHAAFIEKRGSVPDPDNPFVKDTEAIEKAIEVLEVVENIKLLFDGGN